MFRKMMMILVSLLLMTACACAEDAPVLSEDVLLLQRASNALMERYGLDHANLGLFLPEINRCGDMTIVTYTSGGSIHDSLAGRYFVLIDDSGIRPFWTHDDVDPALWQSGELTSPAWGVLQLTAYLDDHPYERADFCTPYVHTFSTYDWEEFFAAGGSVAQVGTDNRAEAEAARDTALSAVQVMYGMTEEELGKLSWMIDMCLRYRYPDGHAEWEIMLQSDDVLDPISYYVTLDAQTHLILRVIHTSGGVG